MSWSHPWRATSRRCPFHDHARGRRAPAPSYLPVPHKLLCGNVPCDRPHGLRPWGRRPAVESCADSRPATRTLFSLAVAVLETQDLLQVEAHSTYENSTKRNPKQEIALILRNIAYIARIVEAQILDDNNKTITLKWNHQFGPTIGSRQYNAFSKRPKTV